jgi:hypothetical protein
MKSPGSLWVSNTSFALRLRDLAFSSTYMTDTCPGLSYGSTQLYIADFNPRDHQSCRQMHVWQAIMAKRVNFLWQTYLNSASCITFLMHLDNMWYMTMYVAYVALSTIRTHTEWENMNHISRSPQILWSCDLQNT